MGIFELYSKRQKKLRGEAPDVYTYDHIPNTLRVQIVHIICDAIGKDLEYGTSKAKEAYKSIHNALSREYGVFELLQHQNTDEDAVLNFFLRTPEDEKALDVIELSFRLIENYIGNDIYYKHAVKVKMNPEEAIAELNERFKENGIGFQYEHGDLIRIDSTFIHSEVVKPTIALLWNTRFKNVNDEYMKAHDHYKHGRNAECLTWCNNAFESTMKIICKEKRWVFGEKDTSKKLVQTCFDNGLIPTFMQTQFTALRTILESGTPTLRNNLGSHGEGDKKINVEEQYARYSLNLTGANIIFLIEQSGIK